MSANSDIINYINCKYIRKDGLIPLESLSLLALLIPLTGLPIIRCTEPLIKKQLEFYYENIKRRKWLVLNSDIDD